MNPETKQRPKWEIDLALERLAGQDVRVAAKSFLPLLPEVTGSLPFIPVENLYLPDNSQPAGSVVFFEGRLRRHQRQIGVVRVWLDALDSVETASDGSVYFRGKTAVILRGPAIVKLAFPFQVERLPADALNYWNDLRTPCVQFWFPFVDATSNDHAKTRKT